LNPLKKLAGQTAIYGIPTIVGRFLNYLLVPLVTYRFTNPGDYGINTEFYAYISFFNILFTYGMETAFFNFSVKEKDKDLVYSTALLSVVLSTTFFFLILISFSNEIQEFLGYASSKGFVAWVVLIIATDAAAAIPFARLRSQNRPGRFAFIKMVNILVNIGLNVFFIGFAKPAFETGEALGAFYSPEIGIGYVFIANLCANVCSLLLLYPEFVQVRLRFALGLWKRMMRYALPLLLVGFAGMINETFDRILLKYLLPENEAMAQVGIYGACYKISILITIFIQAFRYAAEPFFFSQSIEKNAKNTYSRVMNYFVIVCSIIFLGTMTNLSWIQFFIGESYRAGLNVVSILLLANFFLGIYFNLSVWYKITGKTQYGAWITLMGAIITLGINFAFIPKYGYHACAWATLACYGTMMILSWLVGNKHYHVDYDLRRILGYLALSLVLYGISTLVNTGSEVPDLLLKNLIFLGFLGIVFMIERKRLFTHQA
jgi:O-antigen/teichoic acid export membrane protein